MKNQILFITTLFFFAWATTQAQTDHSNPKKNNYLVLSKNIQQLKPVILTAKDLAKEDVKKFGDFYIIICGKTVADIPNNTAFNEMLDQAIAQNIKVYVCGISLDKFKVTPNQMPKNVEITPNGILYGFQLTKKGFITLSI